MVRALLVVLAMAGGFLGGQLTTAEIVRAAVQRACAAIGPTGPLVSPEIERYASDPLAYVEERFPWGRGELERHQGPDVWQRRVLEDVRDGLLTPGQAILESVASGHGVGKSALVGMLVCWAMDTRADTRGVVTANTEPQLATKTWPEISKWFRLGGLGERFELTATRISSKLPGHRDSWRFDRLPWSESRPEAFAGLHNQGKRILIVFDEASSIVDSIWETTEGALTDIDTEIVWVAFGNPTRNTGRFREAVEGRHRHRWKHYQVDSRTARVANQAQIEAWIADYGEDSDFVRVRVLGKFPRASSLQFIGLDLVQGAQRREAVSGLHDPLILGIDMARGGDDTNVLRWRRGLDARSIPPRKLPGSETRDSMRLVSAITQAVADTQPDAIFADGTGLGGVVIDRLRQLGYVVMEVQFGGKASDRHYANKRAEIWARMREWLKHGAIDADATLESDMTGPEMGHNGQDQLLLEPKEAMKRRGLASPDDGDALACTFAEPVAPRTTLPGGPGNMVTHHEYNPFA